MRHLERWRLFCMGALAQIQGWSAGVAVRLLKEVAVSLWGAVAGSSLARCCCSSLARWLSFNLLSAVAVASGLLPLFGPVFLVKLGDQVGGG